MTAPVRPLLSVLVPTYNYAHFIRESVGSVLSQRTDEVEIVIVDDGSTDDTPAVVAPWVESGQVRYFREKNSGPATARNLAMANAQGEYFFFLDADDLINPGCIAATIAFLRRYPQVGMFFTNYNIFEGDEIVVASGVDLSSEFRGLDHDEDGQGGWVFHRSIAPAVLHKGTFLHTSGFTVRRDVVEAVGDFRDGYCYGEDEEFFARVARATVAGYVDRVLSRKRNHPKSIIHDETKRIRNLRHLLELTEIQIDDYADDPDLRAYLRAKLREVVSSYCWHLVEAGRSREARGVLRVYLRRGPGHWPYYKLYAKTFTRRGPATAG